MSGDGSKNWNITKESGGFAVAEFASMVTSLGVVAVADQIIPKSWLNQTYKTVGKILEPFLLDPFEWSKEHLCRLEECKVDRTKSRQERAEEMAKVLILFSSAWAISMRAKLWTREAMNKALKLPGEAPLASAGKNRSFISKCVDVIVPWSKMSPQTRMIFAADEGVHYGSILLMNTVGAPVTDELINSTTRIVQKVTGASEKKAREIADMAVIWELPNVLGMASGIGAIIGKHSLKWPESHALLKRLFGNHDSPGGPKLS